MNCIWKEGWLTWWNHSYELSADCWRTRHSLTGYSRKYSRYVSGFCREMIKLWPIMHVHFYHVAFKSHVCCILFVAKLALQNCFQYSMVMICVYRCAAPGCEELAEDRPRHSLQPFNVVNTHAIKFASHDHHWHTLLTAPPVVLSARDSNLELNGRSYSWW